MQIMENRHFSMSGLKRMIASVGIGFFLVGYNIGTGSVTSMAAAGSRYGLSLLWVLILSCVFSYVLLEAYGRYTIVTGKSALFSYRQFRFWGKPIALITLIALIFVEEMALIGNMGILSDLIREWSKMFITVNGWNPVWIAVFIIVCVYLLIIVGRYSFFEKILIICVVIMEGSFILSMFMVVPSPVEIIKGSIPQIPDEANASMIIAALVGATFTAPTYVVRSILVKEKGWNTNHLKHGRKDALITAIMLFVISGAVMVCGAGTLYLINKPVEDVITMVVLLEPLAGRFALSIFILGIIGAGVSTIIPIAMLAPLLIGDYRGTPINMKSPAFRIICLAAMIFGLIVPVFRTSPVLAMIASQCFQIPVLPVVTISIMYLLNKKDIMGEYKAGFWLNLGFIATLIFSFIISYQSYLGLIRYFELIL